MKIHRDGSEFGHSSERIADLVGNAHLGKAASLGMAASSEHNASLSARVSAMAVFFTTNAFSKTANLGKDVRLCTQHSVETQKLGTNSK